MQVWSLGWEDPLEKDRATHCHILAWRIPRTEEPDGVQSMGSQRVGHDWSNLAYKRRDMYESVLKRGVNLDPIIQSELSQKEKDKCHTLMYIYRWNLERWYWWTSLPGSSGDADVEAGFMDTELEQEGRRNWGGTTQTYTPSGVKLLGSCKNVRSALLNFATWYQNTFLINEAMLFKKKKKIEKH